MTGIDSGRFNNNSLKENLPKINSKLRKFFDPDDPMRMALGYHGFQRSGGRRGSRIRPSWVDKPLEIQKILRRSFPKLDSDPKQRKRAADWAYIIYLYWGNGLTQGKVALIMNRTLHDVNRKIDQINKAAAGLSCNGSGSYRRRGRPKKNRGVISAFNRV